MWEGVPVKRWIVVELDSGDDPEDGGDTPPDYDVFPSCIEIYGEFRVIEDWSENDWSEKANV